MFEILEHLPYIKNPKMLCTYVLIRKNTIYIKDIKHEGNIYTNGIKLSILGLLIISTRLSICAKFVIAHQNLLLIYYPICS